mmetsp:Transcript_42115/g.45728  ORF Transcript_42115/g.45728 Transcript_42115/m.45728 type:complete len:121 (+) Transcript_42115:894-1256(+)
MLCYHGGWVSIFVLAARRSIRFIVMMKRDASQNFPPWPRRRSGRSQWIFFVATPPQTVCRGNEFYSTNDESIGQVPIVIVSVVTYSDHIGTDTLRIVSCMTHITSRSECNAHAPRGTYCC